MAQVLGGQLRDAIWRYRLQDGGFPHGDADQVAVDRGARGVDEPMKVSPFRGLQQSLGAVPVGRSGAREIPAPALADTRLRGQMVDVRLALEERTQVGSLQGAVNEMKP